MNRLLLIFFIGSLAANILNAQGIEFFHGTWEEALQKAEVEQKVIFVDAYTTWCGPCKRMARDVFTKPEAGSYYNATFINVKMNMESPEGLSFGQKYPVRAYPTLLYIRPDGEVAHKVVGGQDLKQLLAQGKTANAKLHDSKMLQETYEEGDRDPVFLATYIASLRSEEKPYGKVINEYLSTQTDLSTPKNIEFIFNTTYTVDSRVFDELINQKDAIIKEKGQNAFDQKVIESGRNSLQVAIKFQSKRLLDEVIEKVNKYSSKNADVVTESFELQYYLATKDPESYLSTAKQVAKSHKKDAKKLNELAGNLFTHFAKNKDCMTCAEKWSAQAAKIDDSYQYYYTYAVILQRNGKKDKAITAAEKSLKLAEKDKGNTYSIQRLLIQLKNT